MAKQQLRSDRSGRMHGRTCGSTTNQWQETFGPESLQNIHDDQSDLVLPGRSGRLPVLEFEKHLPQQSDAGSER
jgi:hypothetical protein